MPVEKQRGCVYCGAVPASHMFLYVDTILSLISDVFESIFYGSRSNIFSPYISRIENVSMHLMALLIISLGLGKFVRQHETDHLDRTQVMMDEARARGIRMEILQVFGRNTSQARAWLPHKSGGREGWFYFDFFPIPFRKKSMCGVNIDNKKHFKTLLRTKGVRVPQGRSVFSLREAIRVMKEIGKPVIVKPMIGSRSRHTRINIRDANELADAFAKAKQLCPFVMVEEYIEGNIYRVTCVGGVVEGVLELVRPTIVADGVSTVKELLNRTNANPDFDSLTPIKDDTLLDLSLIHQGLTRESVPEKGKKILLTEFSERVNGGYFVDREIPDSVRRYLERGARAVCIPLVGFDVISKNIQNEDEPITFLEGNTAPFIEVHHIPYAGVARNIAEKVWDLWLQKNNNDSYTDKESK